MTTNTTNPTETTHLDADLRNFLKDVRACQCLALAAGAAKILRAGRMSMKDLERCFRLGFDC